MGAVVVPRVADHDETGAPLDEQTVHLAGHLRLPGDVGFDRPWKYGGEVMQTSALKLSLRKWSMFFSLVTGSPCSCPCGGLPDRMRLHGGGLAPIDDPKIAAPAAFPIN